MIVTCLKSAKNKKNSVHSIKMSNTSKNLGLSLEELGLSLEELEVLKTMKLCLRMSYQVSFFH